MAEKVEAIAAAQRRGTVNPAMPPERLLALVLAVANMWHQPGEDLRRLVPEFQRRTVVTDAVARLVAP